jgi:hypothetical protein
MAFVRFLILILEYSAAFWVGAYGGVAILRALYGCPEPPCPEWFAFGVGGVVILSAQWLLSLRGSKLLLAFAQQLLIALALATLLACAGMVLFHEGASLATWNRTDVAVFIFLAALFPVAVVYRKIIELHTCLSAYRWR